MRLGVPALLSALAVSVAGPACAQNFALGAGVGTDGIGAQASAKLSDYLVARGSVNWLNIDRDESYDDIDYTGTLDMTTFGAFLDLHPFQNSFLLSGGAYFGDRSVDIKATPTANVQIGGATFTPAQVGRLEGAIDMGDAAPFVGLGFDNTFTTDGAIGFRVLAGAAFGDASASLRSLGGTLSGTPGLDAQLTAEARKVEDDVGILKTYPVVSVGLNLKF